MRLKLLFLTLLCLAGRVFADGPTPKIIVDGRHDEIRLLGLQQIKNSYVRYRSPSFKEYMIDASGTVVTGKKWKEYSFAFTPDRDGTVLLRVSGNYQRADQVRWVEIANINVSGAVLKDSRFTGVDCGSLPAWNLRHYSQLRRYAGRNAIAVSASYEAKQTMEVKKGRRVVFSYWAKEGLTTKHPSSQELNGNILFKKSYYRYFNDKYGTLLPLRDKGVSMKIINGGSKLPEFFTAPEAKFTDPVSDKFSYPAKRRIPVELLEESGVGRLARIRFGLPFARGEFFDLRNVRVIDKEGREIPAQFSAQAFYSDKSVRGALIDCSVPLKSNERKNIFVETGSGVVRDVYPEVMSFSENDDKITVNTGKLQAVINKKSFKLLEDIRVDGRAVGSFDAKGLALYDEHGKLHASSALPLTKVTVEERGVNRLVFKLQGYYGKSKFASFTARIGFRPNSAKVDFSLRFINSNIADEFSDYSRLELEFVPAGAVAGKLSVDDKFSAKRIVQWTDKILESDGKKSEQRLNGFGSFPTADGKISFALKDTWQRYPKGFSVTDKSVKFELLPQQPDAKFGTDLPHYLLFPFCEGFYRSKRGMAFTEELTIDFSGESPAAELGALDVVAVVDRDYVASTGAWQGVMPRSCTAFEGFDLRAQEAFYHHMRYKEQQREYGFFNYGDWYGERGYNWTNNEYDMSFALFMLFFRTGNRDVFRWAQIAARHQADVDIVQCAPKPEWVGNNFPHSIGHTGVGTGSGSAGRRSWTWPAGSWGLNGHTWSRGMLASWTLLGDAGNMDSALLLGEHLVRYAAPAFRRLGTHERTGGWSTIALMGFHQTTGEQKYLDAATRIVKLALSEQNFEKGGAWPHKMPEDHAGGHKNTFGNCPYLIGILTEALHQYYLASPSAELEKSLVAAAGWQKKGHNKEFVGWPYGVSWDGKGYFGPNRMLNYLASPGFMTGGRIANDREIFEICRRVVRESVLGGLSYVGKNLAMELALVPSLMDEMRKFAEQNNIELTIPVGTGAGKRYLSIPETKEFRIRLKADKCKVVLEREVASKDVKGDKKYFIEVFDTKSKITAVLRGDADNRKVIRRTLEINGRAGEVHTVKAVDGDGGVWKVTGCENGVVRELISAGFIFNCRGKVKRYITVPRGTVELSVTAAAAVKDVKVISGSGSIYPSRDTGFGDVVVPWRQHGSYTIKAHGRVVNVKMAPTAKDEIWEVVIDGNGFCNIEIEGVPPLWSGKKNF